MSADSWLAALALTVVVAPAVTFSVVSLALLVRRTPTERVVGRLAFGAVTISFLSSMALSVLWLTGDRDAVDLHIARWFGVGHYGFEVAFLIDRLSMTLLPLVSGVVLVITRFAIPYLHREQGFARFFGQLMLCAVGESVVVLAGSADLLIVGWGVRRPQLRTAGGLLPRTDRAGAGGGAGVHHLPAVRRRTPGRRHGAPWRGGIVGFHRGVPHHRVARRGRPVVGVRRDGARPLLRARGRREICAAPRRQLACPGHGGPDAVERAVLRRTRRPHRHLPPPPSRAALRAGAARLGRPGRDRTLHQPARHAGLAGADRSEERARLRHDDAARPHRRGVRARMVDDRAGAHRGASLPAHLPASARPVGVARRAHPVGDQPRPTRAGARGAARFAPGRDLSLAVSPRPRALVL